MNKLAFLVSILILAILSANAQSVLSPGEKCQISLSFGNTQFKEYLINGLRNTGINPGLGFNYNISKKTLNHEFGLNINAAALWNRYKWVSLCVQSILHYRLLACINDKFQLGGNVYYSNLFHENGNFDSQHNYWITKINSGFSACYKLPVNTRWTLYVPFSLFLFGFLSRPAPDRNLILNEPDLHLKDVLKRMNSNFQFVTIGNKCFESETGLFFRTHFHSGRPATFGYRIHYQQTSTSLKTQLLNHQLSFQYSIGKMK
ncbi:MAG TPA: hypothetical protein VHP36_07970 [Chitinispirillaceae bacterium]|nr:hypothetical protein [Chitinispirillaceae bacterium]